MQDIVRCCMFFKRSFDKVYLQKQYILAKKTTKWLFSRLKYNPKDFWNNNSTQRIKEKGYFIFQHWSIIQTSLCRKRERRDKIICTKLFCSFFFVEMIIMRKNFVFTKNQYVFLCCFWELFRQILDEITHEREREREKREAGGGRRDDIQKFVCYTVDL